MVDSSSKPGRGMIEVNSWNNIIATLPMAHILQTQEWGEIKAQYDWQPSYYIWLKTSQGISMVEFDPGNPLPSGECKAAALVLRRSVTIMGFRLHVLYVPKGPLLDWRDRILRQHVLGDLASLAHHQRAIFIKVDPDVILRSGIPGAYGGTDDPNGQEVISGLQQLGWRDSTEQIQFRNTFVVDLTRSEEALLAKMKQKTRYNLRLAERKGVRVRVGTASDIPLLYQMYAETSVRDGFVIRDQTYYQILWKTFMKANMAEALIAEVDGEDLAAVILFIFAGRAWYLYGMSREVHREKMPNYLLQWEAIRHTKSRGCIQYDLWGAPNTFNESDPMWGVYRFKEGLGGDVVRSIGAWDLPARPGIYWLYVQILPRIMELMRQRGRDRTRQQVRSLTGV
jgi:peptidoglycan pentaglycine glycine transferase (the first glycine)